MSLKKLFHPKITLLAVLILLILSSCSPRSQADPTTVSTPSQSVIPTETATLTPTQAPAQIWLVTDESPDENLRMRISTWLATKAADAGFKLVEVDQFLVSEVPSKLTSVIFLSNSAEISSLAANLPETQFVAITEDEIPPSNNLNVIQTGRNQSAFFAGYLATLVAPDFRSGALFLDGTEGSNETQDSFLNGGRYFCGRCSPVFAPIVSFPQVGLVPVGADAASWQTAFENLNLNRVEMLYLPPEGLLPEFLAYLADKNVGVISNGMPPPGFDAMWIATITTDPVDALDILWPQILSGNGGQTIMASLELTNVNQQNLSIGRQNMAELIIHDLMTGMIEPLTVP